MRSVHMQRPGRLFQTDDDDIALKDSDTPENIKFVEEITGIITLGALKTCPEFLFRSGGSQKTAEQVLN